MLITGETAAGRGREYMGTLHKNTQIFFKDCSNAVCGRVLTERFPLSVKKCCSYLAPRHIVSSRGTSEKHKDRKISKWRTLPPKNNAKKNVDKW